MNILFFGDVIGSLGRQALLNVLPALREKYAPDLIIANVENLAHGAGVTEKTVRELVAGGVDIFTGGNHSWNNPLGVPLFESPEWQDRLIAPTNFAGTKGGRNAVVWEREGKRVVVANLMGQLFSHPENKSPFTALDELITKYAALPLIIDLHAEATAEKEAFGHYADGRVSAVLGTHTHVATADAKILLGGTAYVTDVGRCGAYDSVIGFEKNSAVKAFLGVRDRHYELPKKGKAEVNAVTFALDLDTGRAHTLSRVREILDV